MPTRYQINSPAVIGETVDGEAVIVNLNSGAYYSLRDAGALLWSLLESRPTQAEIVQAMCQRYAGDASHIEVQVRELLTQIEAEELVRVLDDPDNSPTLRSTPAAASLFPFPSLELEKFTDMADMLLLDPIHEVDETAGSADRQDRRM